MENYMINLILDLSKLSVDEARAFKSFLNKMQPNTDSQHIVPLREVIPGTIFRFGGYSWLKVRECREEANEPENAAFVILNAEHSMAYNNGDICRNPFESDVQAYIDEEVVSHMYEVCGCDLSNIFYTWKQTSKSMDGSFSGGFKYNFFSLPSFDFYRDNYHAIHMADEFFDGDWWLFTLCNDIGENACAVYVNDNSLNDDYLTAVNLVYPLACMKGSTLVSVD